MKAENFHRIKRESLSLTVTTVKILALYSIIVLFLHAIEFCGVFAIKSATSWKFLAGFLFAQGIIAIIMWGISTTHFDAMTNSCFMIISAGTMVGVAMLSIFFYDPSPGTDALNLRYDDGPAKPLTNYDAITLARWYSTVLLSFVSILSLVPLYFYFPSPPNQQRSIK